MTTQQRSAAGPSGRPAQPERSLFTVQLWKAAGLQPRQLSISRTVFFPEEALASTSGKKGRGETGSYCPPVPSSSRGSEEPLFRGGAYHQQQHESAKRRRSSYQHVPEASDAASEQPSSSQQGGPPAVWCSWGAPDLEAMRHAPRRARSRPSRRPVGDLQRLTAEFPLPSLEPPMDDVSPAASAMQQQPLPSSSAACNAAATAPAAACQQPAWGPLPVLQHARQQHPRQDASAVPISSSCHHHLQCSDHQQHGSKVACADQGGCEPLLCDKRSSLKGSPASHSAESSLGVFVDLHEPEVRNAEPVSPGTAHHHHHHSSKQHRQHQASQQQQQQQRAAWGRSSPLSSDDAF